MSEKKVQNDILLEASKKGWRLFRNNVAQAWVGVLFRSPMPVSIRLMPGDIVLRSARPIDAGLCKGSSDLIGWESITITPEMVGQKIARFTAIEVKDGKGKATAEQNNFIDNVKRAGGNGKIVYGADEL